MVDNREIFSSDAKAIPSFAPDFVRTERNTVLRIILTMVAFEIGESALVKELELVGCRIPSGAADPDLPRENPAIRCAARPDNATHRRFRHPDRAGGATRPAGRGRRGSDLLPDQPGIEAGRHRGCAEARLLLRRGESEGANVIGSSLRGPHASEDVAWVSTVTFGGKHYEVQSIGASPLEDRVILRRAAEHIHDRVVYRQLRSFSVSDVRPTDTPGARRSEDRCRDHPWPQPTSPCPRRGTSR